jgi:hypothetical protein
MASETPPVSGKRAKSDFEGQAVTRGLPSVAQARADRRKTRWLPARFWLWAGVFVGAGAIVWWKLDDGAISKMRADLLARQRDVTAELGPRWFPLRDKLEGWTAECSSEGFFDEGAAKPGTKGLVAEWDFRRMPGIYLRLAQEAGKQPKTIREAAKKSLRDGFTSCLLEVDNPNPLSGPACETTAECSPGQLCNELGHCADPSQPYNLRTAYKALYMLSEEWIIDTQAISNKLTMRGAVATFDAANKYDLPMATDLLQRSKYFLVVVDEHVDEGNGLDAKLPDADAGAEDDRSIPTAAHPARVCVYRLEDDKKMIAVRREAGGELRGPANSSLNPATQIAQQRQANACALALALREAMGAPSGAQVLDELDKPTPPPPAPSGTASPAPSTSSK